MSEVLARLGGAVSCTRAPDIATLSLHGVSVDARPEPTTVTFSAPAALDLPATLGAVLVEQLSAQQYRISAGTRVWQFTARAAHVHREVATQFYQAIPPRPVPAGKRLFWRSVLLLAANRGAFALLRKLRG
jgi:hypothetical protein